MTTLVLELIDCCPAKSNCSDGLAHNMIKVRLQQFSIQVNKQITARPELIALTNRVSQSASLKSSMVSSHTIYLAITKGHQSSKLHLK